MEYIIKKVKCYPPGNIDWRSRVYISMSMNNTVFHNEGMLLAALNEIRSHTSEITIIVGDYLHRYNERIFSGCSEQEAIQKSLERGKKLIDIFKKVAVRIEGLEWKLLFTYDFTTDPSFLGKFKYYELLCVRNRHFHRLTEYTIDVFLRRQSDIRVNYKKARELCCFYLIEELVIFELLAERGFVVNIYPGNQLPIIKAIVSGDLENVSEPLEKIQAVEIKFRPKPN